MGSASKPNGRSIILPQQGLQTDPAVLEYLKKQGHILPRPKNNVENSTQEPKTKSLFPKTNAELARQKGHHGDGGKIINYGKKMSTSEHLKGKLYDIGSSGILGALGLLNVENTSPARRMQLYNRYNPSGNEVTGVVDFFSPKKDSRELRKKNATGTPEEEAFYANYLGLKQDLIKATKHRRPDGKDNELENAEFVTTTSGMDNRIQAMADTLNLGKLSRMDPGNYRKLKERHPDLPSQESITKTYIFSKDLLGHPNTPRQAHEDLSPKRQNTPDGTNLTGLGALRYFGMQWDDKNQQLHGWDTYNFDWWQRLLGNMPNRNKSLEIRTKIPFNPKKGSKLLRDNLKDYE